MGSIARDVVALTLLGVAVLFTNLGGPRLWDRDEPRNAGCALEMRDRGEWIVPWFNGELRVHKPILLYWLILNAYSMFGVSEFSARFWSATLAIGTVLLTYALGRRLAGPRVGFWAGLILLTTLMFDVAARAATPDSVLIFCVTLALAAFVLGEFPTHAAGSAVADSGVPGSVNRVSPVLAAVLTTSAHPANEAFPRGDWRRPLRTSTALGMYAAMGLAVLAKGPVGAVLPTAVVGMYLLIARLPEIVESRAGWERSSRSVLMAFLRRVAATFAPGHFLRTCWALRPLTALAVILAVAAPWYVWVGVRTDGEFLAGFFWQHNLARAMSSFEGHRGGPWFYPVAVSVGFFPWSVFTIPFAIDLVRGRRAAGRLSSERVFLLCWAGVWIGLFSLARTKLPSYVTPAYHALAVLVAGFVPRRAGGQVALGPRWRAVPLAILAVAGLAIAIALPLAARRYVPGAEWLGAIGFLPLAGALVAAWAGRRNRSQWVLGSLAAASVAFVIATLGIVPSVSDRQQRSHEILAAIREFGAERVGAVGGLEPSWVFYGRQTIEEVALDGRPEVPNRSPFAPRPIPSLEHFLQGKERRALIVAGRHWPALRDRYGNRVQVLADSQKFLKNERLLAIAITPSTNSHAPDSNALQSAAAPPPSSDPADPNATETNAAGPNTAELHSAVPNSAYPNTAMPSSASAIPNRAIRKR